MKKPMSYSLPVTIFREGQYFVAYSPALDLSSSGKSEDESKKMFGEAVDIFFEELTESGTLEEVLLDLGWTKVDNRFEPPELIDQSVMTVSVGG
jgi:predicted RNase H-like HicB family nuclease